MSCELIDSGMPATTIKSPSMLLGSDKFVIGIGGVRDEEGWTHMFGKNKYRLSESATISLIKAYCTNVTHDYPPRIYWRIPQVHPVVIDFTLRFNMGVKQTVLDENVFRMKIIRAVQQSIIHSSNINPDELEDTISAAMFYSSIKDEDMKEIKYKYRVYIPHVRIDKAYDERLTMKIIAYSRDTCSNEFSMMPIGDWENIVSMPKDVLPLLGSLERDVNAVLQMQNIYGIVSQDVVDKHESMDEDGGYPDECLSEEVKDGKISSDFITPSSFLNAKKLDFYEDIDGMVTGEEGESWHDKWLASFFTNEYCSNVVTPLKEKKTEYVKDGTDGDLAIRLLSMVDRNRFIDRPFWMAIGRALHSSFWGSDEGCKLWKDETEKVLRVMGLIGPNGKVPVNPDAPPVGITSPASRRPPSARAQMEGKDSPLIGVSRLIPSKSPTGGTYMSAISPKTVTASTPIIRPSSVKSAPVTPRVAVTRTITRTEVLQILRKREEIKALGVGFSENPDAKGKMHRRVNIPKVRDPPSIYRLPSIKSSLEKFEEMRRKFPSRRIESDDIPHHDECDELYKGFGGKGGMGITVKTLAWYASMDNPEQYNRWHKEWIEPALVRSLTFTHDDVSEAFYRMYWLKFACTSTLDGGWKEYRGSRWHKDKGSISLLQKIRSEFIPKLEEINASMTRELRTIGSEDLRKAQDKYIKRTRMLISKLKNRDFKMKVIMSSCDLFFSGEEFSRFGEQNPNIINFGNGVIELWGTKAFFRSGRPEDYLEIANSLVYDPHLSWGDKHVKRLMEWLRRVYPDPEVLNFWLKYSASRLRGRNSDKIFAIFTGTGNNSKSMIMRLYECTLEDRCVKVPVTYLTTPRTTSSGPSPEIARMAGARIVTADEPGPGNVILPENIKQDVSNDKHFARFLNENGRDFIFTHGLVLLCNGVPAIPNADRATRSRFVKFPHVSEWSEDAPSDEKEQLRRNVYPLDNYFEDSIGELAPAFAWVLVHFYSRYIYEGMAKPSAVKVSITKYWDESDPYKRFIDSCTSIPTDESGAIDMKVGIKDEDLHQAYRVWANISYPDRKLPNISLFTSEIESHWGPCVDHKWMGRKLSQGPEQKHGSKREYPQPFTSHPPASVRDLVTRITLAPPGLLSGIPSLPPVETVADPYGR